MLSRVRRSNALLTPTKISTLSPRPILGPSKRLFSSTDDTLSRDDFDHTVTSLRSFFREKGWKEVTMQHRPSILAACEDPWNLVPYTFQGVTWPLPQTSQMWLEWELLNSPDVPGIFTLSTSYRAEPDPIPGRHQLIFPMFEIEGKGDYVDLRKTLADMLKHLGFGKEESFREMNYCDACSAVGAKSIEAKEEGELCQKFGDILFINRFPEESFPFWNMKREKSALEVHIDGRVEWKPIQIARKTDVVAHGFETIGGAERETDPEKMRNCFETISDGKYAAKLRELFGEERVQEEMDQFLSLDFFTRFGAGIGIHRLVRAMKLHNILPNTPYLLYPKYSIV